MLADDKTPRSPDWWLIRLGKKLSADQHRYDKLERYWRGDPPVPHGNHKMREAYRRLQHLARTNFGALVVETVLERMKVTAFRAGADGTVDNDKHAWGWWQANSLDADSGLVHRMAVMMSKAYVCVGEDPDNPGQPLVTGEDPRQVIHESTPTNRRKILAALKTWWDDIDNVQRAMVYLPDKVYSYVTTSAVKVDATADRLWSPASWELDTSEYPEGWGTNTLGEVPFVPFVNKPDLAGNGMGEYEDVVDVLERINTTILDRMVVTAMQAYRQRWAKGVTVTDEHGNTQSTFDPGADLLWAVEDDNAVFGEFQVTDISPIIKAIESDVQYLAAITRTPPHYLLAGIVNVSGTALGAAETGLVSKLLERETEYGESWERVNRLAGKVTGTSVPLDAEVVWKDPQFRTLAEQADAALKARQAGVPWRTAMAMFGFSPQEIDRMEAERAQDALLSDNLASLSIAEGGELGTRGVSYADKGLPANETGVGAPGTRSGQQSPGSAPPAGGAVPPPTGGAVPPAGSR